jgi:hypothetical protein
MSGSEKPERLAPGREITVEDIRSLAGPATPHFALQIRDRIRRLVGPLPAGHPARAEGELQISRLEELARHSGDPRGPGPLPEDPAAESAEDVVAREETTH